MRPFKSQLELKPEVCYLGLSVDSQNPQSIFGILKEDRRSHLYILGKTGMGKTTLLENMVLQDIYNGQGVCFLDPHGDSSEYILNRIPHHRQNEVVYLDPADIEFPIGLNILESQNGQEPYLVASTLMAVFNRIWGGTWSSRMEYILNNTLLALLETPGNTLLSVVKMLTDNEFQKRTVEKLVDPLVRNFWVKEYANFNSRYRQEAISPILNKIGQFFSSEIMRNILGQEKSTLDLREIMDQRKILIVNLSKGRLGEDNSNLFGSLLVAKLQTAAMSRVNLPEEKRQDFFLYVDEFQNFTTDSFASILSEARKYRLNLILAHQYISQLEESGNEKIKNAVFGNVGTIISFRLGYKDALELSKEFTPKFVAQDLLNLGPAEILIKLSIKKRITPPFKAITLAPIFEKLNGSLTFIKDFSRNRYSKPRKIVSEIINKNFEINQNLKNKGDANKNYKYPNSNQNLKSDFDDKNWSSELKGSKDLDSTIQKKPREKVISDNILNINTAKVKTNRLPLSSELGFSKRLQNPPNLKTDRTKNFKTEQPQEGPKFELP